MFYGVFVSWQSFLYRLIHQHVVKQQYNPLNTLLLVLLSYKDHFSQSNQFLMDITKFYTISFSLIEYFVLIENMSNYGSKLACKCCFMLTSEDFLWKWVGRIFSYGMSNFTAHIHKWKLSHCALYSESLASKALQQNQWFLMSNGFWGKWVKQTWNPGCSERYDMSWRQIIRL